MITSSQERSHKEEKEFRRQANIQELVALKESDRHLHQELERTREMLRIEQQKRKDTIAKVLKFNALLLLNKIASNSSTPLSVLLQTT